ncbi:MAG: hypothetical protein K2K00_02950, partial [Muribaculaceae bacterium]|nr:hypothetical protein [Muribaculaceae bacterium]
MKLKSLYTLATVILLTTATALAAGSTRTGAAKAARAGTPQRIAAAAADIPTQWESIGEGILTEKFTPYLEGKQKAITYKVSVEKSVDKKGWYRIVNPFENNPEVDDWFRSTLITDETRYILIDASDPSQVNIIESPLGIVDDSDDTEYSLVSSSIYDDYPDDAGKLINNVITFPNESSIVLTGGWEDLYIEPTDAFRLELPEVKEDPVIPDVPDDKLTVTIKINEPDFITGIEVYGDEQPLDFVNGELTFKVDEGDELFIDVTKDGYKINSILINGEKSSVMGLMIDEVTEDLLIEIDVERYRDDIPATITIDDPENVTVSQNGTNLTISAGENSITFSNRNENSDKLAIAAKPGCNIISVEQNGATVEAFTGTYEITLKADDVITIKTEKIVVKDPVVTISTKDVDFFEFIQLGNQEVDLDDFENGEITLENVKGKTLRFQCNTEDYNVISFTINGERKSLNSDGTFEITVDDDLTIEFNVVAYKTFNATIKIDDPANAIVTQNGTPLTLKTGENPISFTDKDPASANLTIKKTKFDLNITLNGDDNPVNYDFVNEYFTVKLKNEGDIVEISAEKRPTANVTLKVNNPDFIVDIFAGADEIELDFNEDGEMNFEVDLGAKLTLTGDTDKFKLNALSVDGKQVNNAGPLFSFNISKDTEIEFTVEAYKDVESTIIVDNADAVKVSRGTSFGNALKLEIGDNTFTFNNKNADNGKVTIAPQTGFKIVAVTLNDEVVEAQTGGSYTVVLAEGDTLKIETAVITYDVTIKVSADGYIKSIKNGETAVEPTFEEGAMTLEVAYGSTLAIEGDNENFKFKSLTVDDKASEAEGPEFSFKVTSAMTIEFDVEAYRDVSATINVDA